MARFRRRLRRRGRRKIRRIRRRFGRRRRRSSGFTVGYHQDFELQHCSLVPQSTPVNGTNVGVATGTYATWSIPIVPPNLIASPSADIIGTWSSNKPLTTRSIGNPTENLPGLAMITDLPTCISSTAIFNHLNCKDLARLMTKYRITYCTATFTIPENTSGEKNHHLYLEWTHLPCATACKPDSLYGLLQNGNTGTADDSLGWNWLCQPMDVAEACSIPGKASLKHKWNRAQLTATAPVTIAWRPRHTNIQFDRNYYSDESGNVTKIKHQDEYSSKSRLIRGYLPIQRVDNLSSIGDDHFWLGPVVRLIDADIPLSDLGDIINTERLSKYHIRVSFTIKLKLKGMKASDQLFPNFNPTVPN